MKKCRDKTEEVIYPRRSSQEDTEEVTSKEPRDTARFQRTKPGAGGPAAQLTHRQTVVGTLPVNSNNVTVTLAEKVTLLL